MHIIVASGEKAMEDLLVFVVWRSTCILSQQGQCFTYWRTHAARCLSRISCSNIWTQKGGILYQNYLLYSDF